MDYDLYTKILAKEMMKMKKTDELISRCKDELLIVGSGKDTMTCVDVMW